MAKAKPKNRLKRGAKVGVFFEGVVQGPIYSYSYDDDEETLTGYRVTVKTPKQAQSWWAIVPANAVKEQ